MKKYLTTIVLFVAVAGSSFNKIIVLLDFKLNEDFIASTLCENRDKPASCCHGKCYLKKNLQKEDGTKSGSGAVRARCDINLFCESSGEMSLNRTIKSTFTEAQIAATPSILLSSVFHPPGQD